MLNSINLVGRIATTPELKYTGNGHAVCSFRIAVDRTYKSADGTKEVDFIDVVAWRASANFICTYLSTGRLISVDGRLQIRTWTAADGTNRRTAEVIANDVRALDSPRKTVNEAQSTTPIDEDHGMAAVGSVNVPSIPQTVPAGFVDPFDE